MSKKHQPDIKLNEIKLTDGLKIQTIDYGARLHSIQVPDQNGRYIEVLLNYQALSDYLSDRFYMGAVIGRFANRIHQGEFKLNNQTYQLSKNDSGKHNSLHGGEHGFDQCVWNFSDYDDQRIRYSMLSDDGDQGYPGELSVNAEYEILSKMRFRTRLSARSKQDTIINLTSHPYFNFNHNKNTKIFNHTLMIHSANVLEVDDHLIPSGNLSAIDSTSLDFSESPKLLEEQFRLYKNEFAQPSSFDHSYILDKDFSNANNNLRHAATLMHKEANLRLDIYTNQSAVQFYSGEYLSGKLDSFTGCCLEPQNYPDAPNHSHFPSCILRAGDLYENIIEYEFSYIDLD